MTSTTAARQLKSGPNGEDHAVSVAVQPELMMDYQLTTPYAQASALLAAAPLSLNEVAFYTVTAEGGVAQVAPDPESDTGWAVSDLGFGNGQATGIAAYLDSDLSTVVFASTGTGLYSARSTGQWAWAPVSLGQPGWSVLGVRTQQCAWQELAPVVGIAAQEKFQPPFSQVFGQVSGQAAYALPVNAGGYYDWSPGPVQPAGQGAPVPGAFVSETGGSMSPGVRLEVSGSASPAFLEGVFPVLATAVNSSGWLEAFVIDGNDGNSLNYLSPAGATFAEVPIAQTPGGGGQQVTSYPIGSVAAVTDGLGVIHVIACTTDGTVLHVRQSADAPSGWATAAPIAALGGPAELTAVADHDGDVHAFARADRTGKVTCLQLSVATGDWTIEAVAADVPHKDYVQQIATYSATLTVSESDGSTGAGLAFTVTATEPVTVQIDGNEAEITDGIVYSGITGPDGQVVIVWPTSSLAIPVLYAWFEGMPVSDRVAIDMSGPVQAAINGVRTGAELLGLPSASSHKLEYSTGTVLNGVSPDSAGQAAASIDKVMRLTASRVGAGSGVDARLHPSSRPHAARYVADWDGAPVDRIDRTGLPDQHFLLRFDGSGPLLESLDAGTAAAIRAQTRQAGSFLPDVSWGDVFGAVADLAASVSTVVVKAVGDVIDATITMVVDGITYVWDAAVRGAGQLLDLVQTIFASLKADFWALVGWVGWVFNWNDILLTHEAISYFVTNGLDWTGYGLNAAQGLISDAIAGLQADIGDAVSTYLASQVPAGSTLASVSQSQPAPPAGTVVSGDPRNVFGRGMRTHADSGTVTPGPEPTTGFYAAAQDLNEWAQEYANAALGSSQLQDLAGVVQPTGANPGGVLDQPLAKVIEAIGDTATWGLGVVGSGAGTVFGLAGEIIDGLDCLLTQTWDIPLVTDIYKWVTGGSDLSALDVMCLLLAVPATITYKVMFGETPIPDEATLSAIMAAYPPPSSAGAGAGAEAGAGADAGAGDTPTPLEIGVRLGNILTGLSYIASGFFEARVDLNLAMWTQVSGYNKVALPRCPADWQSESWAQELSPTSWFTRAFIISECMTSMFSGMVTLAPNWLNLDCSQVEGMANWMWLTGNLQWVLDALSYWLWGTPVQALWEGGGPALISIYGAVQIILGIVAWCRLGSKGWMGSLAGLLTSVPNLCKYLMSPQAQWAADGIPICALIEAALDVDCNLVGGIFYILAGAIES